MCERGRRACLAWGAADGFHALTAGASTPTARDPLTALEQIDKAEGDALFVLKDFHECWSNAQIKRKLRGVAQRLKFSKKSIIVVAPAAKVPEELKDEAVVVEYPPPTAAELFGSPATYFVERATSIMSATLMPTSSAVM